MSSLKQFEVSLAAGESAVASGPAPEEILRNCPDCGSESMGAFCPRCGEEMQPQMPSVKHYLKELLHDVVALDQKLLKTIPALLFRPGFLTKEYIAGRRKKYLLPSRLYLLTAFLVFFLMGAYVKTSLTHVLDEQVKTDNITFGTLHKTEAKQAIVQLISLILEVSPYVILLFSTPAFALILTFLYRKKHPLFVEHLIFSFHFFAFSLPVIIAGSLIAPTYGFVIGTVIFLVYLYLAMKRVYNDSGWGLFGRFVASSTSYFGLAFIAIVLSGIAGLGIGRYTGEIPHGDNIGIGVSGIRDSIVRVQDSVHIGK